MNLPQATGNSEKIDSGNPDGLNMAKLVPLSEMPLNGRHWYILAVASMEQLIGTAVSAVAGIMLPLILLAGTPGLSALDQGFVGASSLVGIAAGSVIFGKLMDRTGYLLWFRICPLIIAAGSVGVYFSQSVPALVGFLCLIGLGVGGGYSLDSGYISEIMPKRWESFLVGLAKAACSLGFIGGAGVSYLVLKTDPSGNAWPKLIIFVGFLGIITFLLRIRWYQSPDWLLAHGREKAALDAARKFFGPNATVSPVFTTRTVKNATLADMFKGQNFTKVLLSGVSWACEGLGVYGFGVFLPVLVMALGLQGAHETGIPGVLNSVQTTFYINLFIAAGFALGLAILHKINILRLMGWSFIICALALAFLLAAYELKWPVWTSFICFVVFEIALNAGPHLVTYIVPSRIYSVAERGAGMGIATMLGKIGAVLGVFFMPTLLSLGGVAAVLSVSILVQLAGAAVTFICGKRLNLL